MLEEIDEKKEFDSFSKAGKTGWGEYRKIEGLYELKSVYIESLLQTRRILILNENKQREYEMLQNSRGLKDGSDNIADLVKRVKSTLEKLEQSDLVRIKELESLLEEEYKNIKVVAEMGFRTPRLLNYYKKQEIDLVKGYDVVKLNVIVGKKLGFDVEVKDFNDYENLDLSDINDVDLFLSYHVMEHISRPDLTLKKIYKHLTPGAMLHVEIPIEPDGPRIRYGHLFPFHEKDMHLFLVDAGFKILHFSNKTHPGGSRAERYLVRK